MNDIKSNINRLHLLLSNKFSDVEIEEKASSKIGQYFKISINEGKQVDILIPFKNIDNKSIINWEYLSNPLDENSYLISRKSDIDSIPNIVSDIIDNNKFSSDYIEAIK